MSSDGGAWFVVNASPEVRRHIESFPPLHPRSARDCPIDAFVLTNGDLDHCLGLLTLRESSPLFVYATERVRRGFTEGNVLYRTLERFPAQVTWRTLRANEAAPLLTRAGRPSGLTVRAVPVPGKLPVHLAGAIAPDAEDNVGLVIANANTGRSIGYFPAVARPSAELHAAIAGLDALFFDGTFWSSDELVRTGLGSKRAEDMAHWPVGGEDGSLGYLASLSVPKRFFIHVNNTNPMLVPDSEEALAVRAAGVEVAHDGMDVVI